MQAHRILVRFAPLVMIVVAAAGLVSIISIGGAQEVDIWTEAADSPAAPVDDIDARADRILRDMSEYLQKAREFTFHADVTYDEVRSSGQKIQYGGASDVSVRRPDGLHAKFDGDHRNSRTFYDGKTFTIHDAATDLYSITEVPPKIDDAVDLILDKYGFTVPIADFVYADPYAILIENVQSASVVGVHAVAGTPCHHLAFTQETIDWQIWIAAGPEPTPRKLVITYKNEPGSPQYTARMSNWELQPKLPENVFTFQPPPDASQIDFLPIKQREDE